MAAKKFARRPRKALDDVTRQLAALEAMTVSELSERYAEVFGRPTRSRNKPYLKKRVAFRIQELAEGGLSARAKVRIQQLAADATPLPRHRRPKAQPPKPALPPSPLRGRPRDARLPSPGTMLRRTFRDRDYEVTVLMDGFDFQGQRYRSLSSVAREITGTQWNGFAFFKEALKSVATS